MSEGELKSPWNKWFGFVITIIFAVYMLYDLFPTSFFERGAKPPPVSKGQILKVIPIINREGDSFLISPLNPDETSDPTKVKISDICAVLPNWPGGAPAKDRLAELVVGKSVNIYVVDSSQSEASITIVGHVHVDNVDVAETLVREGHAWVASGSRNSALRAREKDAKARKVGLWGMPEFQKNKPYNPFEKGPVGWILRGYLEMLVEMLLEGWRAPAGIALLVLAAFVFWRGTRRVRVLQALDPKPPPDFRDVNRLAGRLFLLSICVPPALLVLAFVLRGILIETKSEGPRPYALMFVLISAMFFPPFCLLGLVLREWVRQIGKRGYFHFLSAKYTGVAALVGANAGVALLLTEMPGEAIMMIPFLWPVIFVSALFGAIALALFGYLIWTFTVSRGQKISARRTPA
jgi:endonuclease YncB( thermonuclease family)